jgi:regulator of protease activity HflC (stomatin/prohibitin superfamily)
VNDEPIRPKLPFSGAQATSFFWRLLSRLARTKIFWIATGALFVMWCGPSSCSTYVPPNMVGLKQIYYGNKAGIKPESYGPGLHWLISGVERMHLFPHDLQLINFSDSSSEASQRARQASSIKIQTSDGYNVQLDVSLLFHIQDPYKVFIEAGPGRAYEDSLLLVRADRILRKTLGELNSEEFYQGPKRIEKARAAHDQLAAELAPYGIEVDGVLVRRYVYDERYQQLIEGRKIKDQTVFLRQAEAKSAIEQRKRDTAIAEGKAQQDVELTRGSSEVAKLQAQADLYKRKKAAEGKLLVELAEAKGTELENKALEGAGSENLVGMRMAQVLQGVKVLVLDSAGMNPLDLQSILKKFEVR